jgi:hypothetical protein
MHAQEVLQPVERALGWMSIAIVALAVALLTARLW